MIDMELWKQELDKLPHGGNKISKNRINWNKCIGCKVKGFYDNINFEIKINDYDGKYLYIKYLDKPVFKIGTGHFQECKLGKLLGIHTNEFKIEIGQIFKDDKRDLVIIDKKIIKDRTYRNRKYYKYRCNKCGFDGNEHYKNGEYYKEHWILEEHLLKGIGCTCCHNIIVVPKINDMWTTNSEQARLLADPQDGYKYTENSHSKVDWKCLNCGEIIENKKICDINQYRLSCPKCSDGVSYPEKIMYQVLKDLNIDFIYQYSPDWCKYEYKNKLRKGIYDFYFELNGQKYIIEMDGDFHNTDNKMNGQTKEDSKLIDDIKDRLAKKHNVIIIRIDCKKSELKFIKDKILHSKLNDLFNLNNIDWIKCEEFALSSLVKKACDLWNNGIRSTGKIGKILKLSRGTIIRYLKKGNIVSWCNYNTKKEKNESIRMII